ncbi:MAG: hypothetical protein ACPLUL_10135 [Thermanaerothrix sp.]|jgi:hypothetical protein|uniref:Uncharacterized protein n=1 Tax=Thermanaerothrix solaris TaxID=3058434 RepID=A0ABU3NPG8_9CHLR|nr:MULTISPECIES: hypothetical protein [unclassified Thermanaerothrix]MDT8898736.1 hypothetical protein [Thermanaerothrix sp. 4228-RoL]
MASKSRSGKLTRKEAEQRRQRIQQYIFAALAVMIILAMIITAVVQF